MKANAPAWRQGKRLLERSIGEGQDFAFETTLGGSTMTRIRADAAGEGFEVRIFDVGLATPELHIERECRRVRTGGHDIGEADIRRRWRHSRMNLIRLLPVLTELRTYDNSAVADPAAGDPPHPVLVLHVIDGGFAGPPDLSRTPGWARPIVAAAHKQG